MLRIASFGATTLALALASTVAAAQATLVPGTDVSLGKMDGISALGRTGAYPNGVSGVALATTSCNKGTVKVPWEAAMLENHPFISFLVARESNGRLVQVSDRSYVKHGFYALTDDYCDICTEGPFGGGTVLGIGCSDTYSVNNNGDQFWLAPASEVNPWLGEWDRFCSHFDRGEPAVGAPLDCDGNRSLSTGMASALNPVGHRINITDQQFLTPGTWYYQAYYVILGEPGDDRENNWGTRRFTPTWSGAKWATTSIPGFQNGSVLERWAGALVKNNGNGDDDGRLYVAVKVTGPDEGLYHYEYAFQNRDNHRGGGDVSIPICAGARIENVGFSDVDHVAGNEWTASIGGASLDFAVNGNPLRWNTIYNVWFDSDAAPATADVTFQQFDAGPGLAAIDVESLAPTALSNPYLGDGCSLGTEFPSLYANGQATLGNSSFALGSAGNQPAQPHLLVASTIPGAVSLGGGCTQWFGGALGSSAYLVAATTTDGVGVATYPVPISGDPSWEGLDIYLQAASLNPGGGPLVGLFDLSSGLQVRVGSSIPRCP